MINHPPEGKETGPGRDRLTDVMDVHELVRDHAAGVQGGTRTDLVVGVQENPGTVHEAAAQEETEIDHVVGVPEEGREAGLAVGALGETGIGHVFLVQRPQRSELAILTMYNMKILCIVMNFYIVIVIYYRDT